MSGSVQEIHLFPLNTVLFPGGALPLKVFEQRYIEMTKICLRENRPFGVCLIREGREVAAAAVPEPVGCLAAIEHWDMPQLGVFQLLARGGERFRIREMRVAPNHLISATVDPIPPDNGAGAVDPLCREVLQAIVEKVGAERFPVPRRLDDAAWVGYRLAEVLPLETRVKQELLELTDAGQRLARLRALLLKQGISDPGGSKSP
ncbi:MAG: LON peptidase substrate-binding domain-containing protein [Betaproteobacteria bacterium]|nr:LON peptidase substrate-binding domain-containing protein [Betaproteobacteria bacterium]